VDQSASVDQQGHRSVTITSTIGEFLAGRTTRRSFVSKATLTAAALSVSPVDFLLKPGSAYAFICECVPGTSCDCSQLCCDGYTQFCCTINDGINACPPGTFAGGWWKADGSIYCAGPRYYIDCMGECQGCGCGGGSFCPGCDGLTCECALGSCDNRHVGCTEFRYGQCHQEIACSGRIACRMVSCTPPWVFDPTCTTVAQTDDNTANHFAPCQNGPTGNGFESSEQEEEEDMRFLVTDSQGIWLFAYGNYGHVPGDQGDIDSIENMKAAGVAEVRVSDSFHKLVLELANKVVD
jgi:hypothetical protein